MLAKEPITKPAATRHLSLLLLAAMLLAGCGDVDLELSQEFQEAQKTFDQATSPDDFSEAAAMYQDILDKNGPCGAVFYNQGNAFMQAEQPGRAIAAYRQAQRYLPRDPYLEANLAYALGSGETTSGRRPLMEHLLFWQNWIAYPTKFHFAAGLCVLAFALAIAALLMGSRLLRRATVAGLVLSALMIVSAGYDWYRFDCVTRGVVVGNEVVARKGNAQSYEPAFTEALGEGTEFQVVDRRGNWILIRLAGDQEGWIEDDTARVY
jgi:tetratricopeptide (TPR) repeat protein